MRRSPRPVSTPWVQLAQSKRRLERMRLARFSKDDTPRYALVQTDEADGNDYLVVLDGYPFAGQVSPTGERIPLEADGVRLLSPVIPSKVYGLAKNYEAHAQYMYEQGQSTVEHADRKSVV